VTKAVQEEHNIIQEKIKSLKIDLNNVSYVFGIMNAPELDTSATHRRKKRRELYSGIKEMDYMKNFRMH